MFSTQRFTEEWSLEKLVKISLPSKLRDPLVARRRLPRFGLKSAIALKRSALTPLYNSPPAKLNASLDTVEAGFLPYGKAEKRNHTLKTLGEHFELTFSPLQSPHYAKSSFPTAELTPELIAKQEAVRAFRLLHQGKRSGAKSATSGIRRKPTPSVPSDSFSRSSRKSVLRPQWTVEKPQEKKQPAAPRSPRINRSLTVESPRRAVPAVLTLRPKAVRPSLDTLDLDSPQVSPGVLSPKYNNLLL